MSAPNLNGEKSWPREIAECLGFGAMSVGALAAWSGNLTLDKIGGAVNTVTHINYAAYIVPTVVVLAGVLICLGSAGILIRVARKGRHSSWHYRRRWARAMDRHALTDKHNDKIRVPRIRSVRTGHAVDTVSVRMLPGQTAADWHAKTGRLAEEFGAVSAWVELDAKRPHTDVGLVFARSRQTRKELLAPSNPLALPSGPPPRPVLRARAQRATLRVDWARVRLFDINGRPLRGPKATRWGLRVNWGMQWAATEVI